MGAMQVAVGGPEPVAPAAPEAEAEAEPQPVSPLPPPLPEPDADAPSNGDADGARLTALNMALSGTPREETDRYLADNYDLPDRDAILDEVYATLET